MASPTKKEKHMAEEVEVFTLVPAMKEAVRSKKFMVSITFVDKDGNLQHRLTTFDFSPTDMMRSHEEVKKLITNEIKRMLAEDVKKASKA